MTDLIVIQSFSDTYRFLSNFWMAPVAYDGEVWPSAEHAYQGMKAVDVYDRENIRSMPTPDQAKRAGRHIIIRSDWEDVKRQIMLGVVLAKFSTNSQLRKGLITTNPAQLIEGNTWHDNYWGNCTCGNTTCETPGENALGKILESVRYVLL